VAVAKLGRHRKPALLTLIAFSALSLYTMGHCLFLAYLGRQTGVGNYVMAAMIAHTVVIVAAYGLLIVAVFAGRPKPREDE
jgi:hypothetical protein